MVQSAPKWAPHSLAPPLGVHSRWVRSWAIVGQRVAGGSSPQEVLPTNRIYGRMIICEKLNLLFKKCGQIRMSHQSGSCDNVPIVPPEGWRWRPPRLLAQDPPVNRS